MEIEVTTTLIICDVCERRDAPAYRYTITVGDSPPVRRDLCAQDAEPIVAVFGLRISEAALSALPDDQPDITDTEGASADDEEPAPAAPKKAAARKAAVSKTAAEKTSPRKAAAKKTAANASRRGSRRGPGGAPVMTLEEIEAMKKGTAPSDD
ncbi:MULTISPECIES: hypothetical protein [Streptomyces]|uniref:hypothetical protein n=1 Tax=Streptomyces TaxID=1883 RepID=UPI002E29CAD3|nr:MULTISPECIES: hypothetical protein [Streptomyces]